MNIGKQIKQRRLALNLTQEQVAEKIFVSVKSISNWENEKNFPDIESLIRLAKLYDLSLDDLLLEDSAIVKDMKAKTELHDLQTRSNISQGINIVLAFTCIGASIYGDIPWQMQIGLTIVIFLNLMNIFWFTGKIRALRKETEKTNWKEEIRKNKLFFILLVIILILIAPAGAVAAVLYHRGLFK